MSDKARLDFEEEFLVPAGCSYSSAHRMYKWSEYVEAEGSVGEHPHNALWESWVAAREKYEPRWIPVSERLPEPFTHVALIAADRYQNCPDVMQGHDQIKDVGYYNPEWKCWSARGQSAFIIPAYTHWMQLPSAPSTQGGGE